MLMLEESLLSITVTFSYFYNAKDKIRISDQKPLPNVL